MDPVEAERLLQVEISYWRRELSRAYARGTDGAEELLALSRVLDRALLRYQAAFAAQAPTSLPDTPSQ